MERAWVLSAVAIGLILTLAVLPAPAAAHPPEELTLIYDERMGVLSVSIKHDVKDRTTHYIEMVRVFINDALVIEQPYDTQPRDSFILRFSLEADEGDLLKVCAACNIEGMIEQELEVGKGISEAGTNSGRLRQMIMVHAMIHTVALVLAIVAMPGGYHFYNCWKRKNRPTGRRRLHARIGILAVILWGVGSLAGLWITYMLTGDFLGSIHGWMALATFVAALFTGYTSSPKFRKAGYGMRMQTHMLLSFMTIALAGTTMLMGAMAAGYL